jgi:glycosyltransferase involved in cell wall biosynthesis
VARLEHEKGLDRLIDALCELKRKDVVLVVAGKGSMRSELEQLALKRGVADRVIFAGAVPREEIWSFYKDADAFLLLSRAEALGLVFWEAMYAGLPVIGSRAVGIVETIGADEERGFFWEPGDGIEALAERLQMCFDRDAAERRLKLARAYVEAKMSDTNSIYTLYQLCKKS